MGGKGSKTQTATSTNTPPPEVMKNYADVTAQAKQVAQTPYTPYSGQLVAPFNSAEQSAQAAIPGAATAYQPYYGQAQGLIGQGTQQFSPTQFSAGAIGQYENPYTEDVIKATMANINQENAKQQQAMTGNAIASGAWGGDRADLAKNDLARQQALASGQTIAGLENQKYQQALGQFNTANQTGLQSAGLNAQTALQGAGLQGAMGNYASQLGLAGAGAQLSAGALQQQTDQNANTANYQQFQQQQAYPFQTTQWLSNLYSQGAGQMGGTSTTTQPNQNYQSPLQSVLGTGLSIAGMFLKDGGAVEGYAGGGGISNIPDFGVSYIPLGASRSGGSSIPQAPTIVQESKNQSPIQAGFGGLSGALSGFGGYADTGGGLGNTISNMFKGSSIGGGYYGPGFARGGNIEGYAPGGIIPGLTASDGDPSALPYSSVADIIRPNMDGFGNTMSNAAPIAGFKDPTGSSSSIQPSPTTPPAITAGQSFPAAPQLPTSISPSQPDQPSSLTDLQATLASNAPKLDKGQALMAAGAAIMQGGLKNNTQALGAGLQAGLENYAGQKASVRDYALKQAEVQKQVEQLALAAKYHNEEMDLRKEQIEQGKFGTPVAGMGKDENGKDVPGSYITNQKTGEMTFKPGVVQTAKTPTATQQSLYADPTIVANNPDLTPAQKAEALRPDIREDAESLIAGNNPSNITTRNGQRQNAIKAAYEIDPDYDPSEAPVRAQAMKNYVGGGKGAMRFAAMNTFAEHAARAVDGFNALNNDAIKAGNSLKNYMIENATKDSRVAVLKNDIDTLVAERGKILNPNGQLTDAAKNEGYALLNEGMNKGKGIDVIKSMAGQTLEAANSEQYKYTQDVGRGSHSDYYNKKADAFIKPSSRSALERIGVPVKNLYGAATSPSSQPPAVIPTSFPADKEGKSFTANGQKYKVVNGKAVPQ